MKIEVGQEVTLRNTLPAPWFKIPPKVLTGTISKIFKNGKLAIAIDQLPNKSEDGKKTLHFPPEHLIET